MSKALIKKLRAERDGYLATANGLLAKVEADTELSESEQKNLDTATNEASALDERIADLIKTEMARLEAQSLDAKFDGQVREFATVQVTEQGPSDPGTQFTESDSFKTYAEAPSGNSGRVTISQSAFAVAVAYPGGVGAGAADLPAVSRVRDAATPNAVTPLLDVIGYEPVSSNSVDWIEWPADPVPGGPIAEGGTKPEVSYQPLLKTGALEKWAFSVPFTREMLEDVPRFQAMVNGALFRGLRRKAEANAGVVLEAGTYASATGSTLLAAIRTGIATAEMAGYPATAVAINPLDYAQIDVDLLASTLMGARKDSPLWGIRVVPAAAITAGTAYVGDFQSGLVNLDRQVTALYMTDSHAEEFLDNVLRVLAESRSKVVVQQAAAIVECTVA